MTMMLGAAARTTSSVVRRSLPRLPAQTVARRGMAGGHYMTVSENHRIAAEVFGTVCWLWVFHRARHDLPVVLGWRHPWEHDDDGHGDESAHAAVAMAAPELKAGWDKFDSKTTTMSDDDDDDEDDDEE